jgi:hypothetical protein
MAGLLHTGTGQLHTGALDVNGRPEEVPLVHKVVVPPRGNVVNEVRHGLWETFFYDAPVGQFRGRSRRAKSWLGLQYIFPILGWLPSYRPRTFASDFVAGLTIASLAVPQVLLNPPKILPPPKTQVCNGTLTAVLINLVPFFFDLLLLFFGLGE